MYRVTCPESSRTLDGEITLLQTMEDAATDTNRSKVRDMLGSFPLGAMM
jgi:hypothetical protein